MTACLLSVTACLTSGTRLTAEAEPISATGCVNARPETVARKASAQPAYKTMVEKATATTVQREEARLEIGAEALGERTEIGVTPLTEAELPPLSAGMENVTKGPRRGYRFTPTPFTFEGDITVSLPYDAAALQAAGLNAQDVRTYYFDEEGGCWHPLERVKVDEQAGLIVSRTNHFTDMVNAAVTTPESPEQVSLDPTEIKGIQAASPATGVGQIEAPSGNSRGDARLSYPLELPAGRAGLQPALALGYSSEALNGWLGVGWDLAFPAVTIDTRWGVPRYDTKKESETYLLGSEQLAPVAHQGAARPRSAPLVFHRRVEGAFDRIVRRGDSPATYTWEVTDKKGVRSFYGGEGATLADDKGNVFSWALREIRDLNDNTVHFQYATVSDPGVENGRVAGRALYPKKITYTGRGDADGPYSVTFLRDRDLGEQRRPDVMIDARGGFKHVVADLLRRVEIRLNDQPVRHYDLGYRVGAFNKTLLDTVKQYDAAGKLFTTHRFGYFDDIRDADGTYEAFSKVDWTSPDDNVRDGFVNGIKSGAGEAGALNGNTSTSVGGHLYVGWGALPSKSGSVGVKAGYSQSDDKGMLALIDVDGDHLPDKVFRQGNGFVFRKNLSRPGGRPRFAADVTPLRELPAINGQSSSSRTVGVEAYPGAAAVQLDHVDTISTTDRYFTDVNADGISDLVDGGEVRFGRVGSDGAVTYGAAADTPVPIGVSEVSADGLLPDYSADTARRDASFPLVDSLRRWTAPYTGTVRITGAVKLEPGTGQRHAFAKPDGVRVAIQHEDTELWSATIPAADHAEHTPEGTDTVAVRRGQNLYFRVGSVKDGTDDQVTWDPRITYTDLPETLDANGLPLHAYQASQDFTLAGRSAVVTAPADGTLRLGGAVTKKAATTDDVTVVITRKGQNVFEKKVEAAFTGDIPVSGDFAVQTGDELTWRIKSDSPIDVRALDWAPTVQYTTGDSTEPFAVPYDADTYPVELAERPAMPYTVAAGGTLSVTPRIEAPEGTSGQAVFTVKKRGALLAKTTVELGSAPGAVQVEAAAGDELYFDFTVAAPELAGKLTVGVDGVAAAATLHTGAAEAVYGRPYRGWAVAGYNGNGARATQPVNQGDLAKVEDIKAQLPQTVDPQTDREAFEQDPRITPPKAIPFAPQPGAARWGSGDFSWVAAGSVSSSRLGGQTIGLPDAAALDGVRAVPRMSRTQQISLTGSVGGDIGSVGGSIADGTSTGELDYFDMNGDNFPDIVGSGGIQYTDPSGVLGDTRGDLPDDRVRRASVRSGNASAGSAAKTVSIGRGHVNPTGSNTSNTATAGNDMPPLGIGGNLGSGKSEGKSDLIDINGDGLPDRVESSGFVSLNLGYSFAEREPWPGVVLNDGRTANSGLNIGFNTDFYGLAGGASFNQGDSLTRNSLMDVNGDGLTDQVIAGSPLKVALNTGTEFAPPVDFNGSLDGVGEDVNARAGAGAYFTIRVPILFGVGGWIIINPGADTSTGASRAGQLLRDLDGDGYADHLASGKDDQLTVAANQTGRTNLLKSVQRPLGSSFELDYARDGNTYDLPTSKWVLTSVKTTDGLPGDGPDVRNETFSYKGGKYDRLEREFLGYGAVVSEQRTQAGALYRAATTDFDVSAYVTRGLVRREVMADAEGRPFTEIVNTYEVSDVGGGAAYPHVARVDSRWFEGQATAGEQTRQDMTYDDFGNRVRAVDHGEDGTADDVVTTIRYTTCDETNVRVADQSEVRGGGEIMRRTESEVDCATGNVTRHRSLLEDGTAAVTDMEYFDTGMPSSRTDPENHRGQRYKLTYTYDEVTGGYVASTTDSFGLESTATYDLRFGQKQTVTDANGQRMTYAYDAVGRLATVTGPLDQTAGRPTIAFEYHPEAEMPYAVTRHVDKNADGTPKADTIDTVTFTDGLGRAVQSKRDATLSGAAAMTVSGRIVFDEFGRTAKRYYPSQEPKGTDTTFNAAFDDVRPTSFAYDVLDRTTRTDLPDQTSITNAYGFGPDRSGTQRFEMAVTDAEGNQRRTYTDVRKNTVAVREPGAKPADPPIWTSYAFDPLNQITKVTDDRGNATTSGYDRFGRQTTLASPDNGTTRTTYDPAGNVVSKINANGAAIGYTYDFDRLTAIDYPVFTDNNVSYTYGAPGAAGNAAGRLTKIEDAAGTVERVYGPMGEVVQETRTLPGPGPQIRTFTTGYRYDSFNRMLQLTYPDGEVLSYSYDTGGLPQAAAGVKNGFTYSYLASMAYDKFGQRLAMELGNGVRTTFAYGAEDRRLATLKSTLTSGYVFQNLGYGYDDAGNITQIDNDTQRPGPSDQSRLGGPSRQTFTYDDLYRLTSATGAYAFTDKKTDTYTLSMTYDTIHNVTAKDQRHAIVGTGNDQVQRDTTYSNAYAFAGGRPHAPSAVGADVMTYDAAGNLIDRVTRSPGNPRRQLIWDEDSRLACVHDHAKNATQPQDPSSCYQPGQPPGVRFLYDDQGQRMVKDGPQTTLYPSQFYTARNQTEFKHVFAGTVRIASKTVRPGNAAEQDEFFYHGDHLDSTLFGTDAAGKLAEHMNYFPTGEVWVDEHPGEKNPYQFTGKELDPETGYGYHGARYYDPRSGLWQSPDPILASYLEGGPNQGVYDSVNLAGYTYARNNPVGYRDPNGEWGIVGHHWTPIAAALAAGLPSQVATDLGRASWAPDTDSREAMSAESMANSFSSTGHYQGTHLLTGGNAAETQRVALERFKQVVDEMNIEPWPLNTVPAVVHDPFTGAAIPVPPEVMEQIMPPRLSRAQENILHAFGDSFAHVNLNTAGQPGCPCMFSPPEGHLFQWHRPDDPNRNPAQYRLYVGGLYDVFAARAQRAGLKPRVGKEEFVEMMMRQVASQTDEEAQVQGVQGVIRHLDY